MVLLLVLPTFVVGQKKQLTHKDYQHWKDLKFTQISYFGHLVTWEVNPSEGDGMLFLYNDNTKKTHSFSRGSHAQISHKENYVVFRVKPKYEESRNALLKKLKGNKKPQDQLVVFNVSAGRLDTLGYTSGYKMPTEYEGVLAYKKTAYLPENKGLSNGEKKDTLPKQKKFKNESTLIVYNLKNQNKDTVYNVSQYVFGIKAADLYYTLKHKKHDSIKGVYHHLENVTTLLDTNGTSFKKLTVYDSGKKVAWLSTQDSAKAKVKQYALNLSLELKPHVIIKSDEGGLLENYMVSEKSTIRFSKDGKQLFFDCREIPESLPEDTTMLESEKVLLDVWSYTDTTLQPAQKIRLKKGNYESYLCILNIELKQLQQLESKSLRQVSYNYKNVTPFLAANDKRASSISSSWKYPMQQNLYVINSLTGERTLVYAKATGSGRISPAGKYLYWYEKTTKKWYAYHIDKKELIVLNHFKEPVYNVQEDRPMLPGAYGIGGWTELDEKVYIYDEFDIWEVDLDKVKNPSKLTNGREERVQYRMYRLDSEELFIKKTFAIKSFNKNNKSEGFYLFSNALKTVNKEQAYRFMNFKKAKGSRKMIWVKSRFDIYPDLHYSNEDFSSTIKLSNVQEQVEQYNWGTVELIDYKAKKFGKQQALLYKPEDFDPNKKYPVIVYFYERYADLLHYHFGFKPSRSTVNFAYFTSNGYLVLVPDILYEEGEPGKSAYNCVVSAAKELAKLPYVDAEKMAIQGQSWGGYQVAYLVTQTDLFKCAMAGAPVSNMTSAYGGIRWGSGLSRMFQYESTQSRIGLPLWEDVDQYIRNSPVFYSDDINTPLLIMHNDNDGAVPWYQGIEYFVALRRLQKPAWMLVYNNEEHNLEKWHNRIDLSIRMSQFFDHYLKEKPMPNWMKKGVDAKDKERNTGLKLLN